MNTPRPPASTEPRIRIESAAKKRSAPKTRTASARTAKAKAAKKKPLSVKKRPPAKKKAVRKPSPPRTVTSKKVTSKKVTSKKVASKKVASKKVTSKKVASKKVASKKKKVSAKKPAAKKKVSAKKPAVKKKTTTRVTKSSSPGPKKRMVKKKTVKKKNDVKKKATESKRAPASSPRKSTASQPRKAVASRNKSATRKPSAAKQATRRKPETERSAQAPSFDGSFDEALVDTERKEPVEACAADAVEERGPESNPVAPPSPEADEAPSIPPLPEEDEEIVPYEEAEKPSAPARKAPPGTAPAAILAGIRRGEYHVSALGALDDGQIARLARDQGLKVRERERRSETLYRLLQEAPARRRPQNVFVEGLLELHPDGYGFLRRPERSYGQHPEDVYVAAGLIRKLGLKPGHWISGTARQSRPGEPLLALQFVEEVNHEDANDLQRVTVFENLTVVFPDTRFLLEVAPEDLELRVIDLFCPLGRGQRALIVSPPRAGKTVILQKLADAIAHNSPDVDIVVLLVDERPEEVTNMRRSVRGEVIASTFDRPATNHIRIAELVMEKVKRMVENGRHVVLLLDSITRLGRAYNNTSGPSGRILTGGLEAKALTKPKRFFGAARNIEDGGSLTIVATALVETGSRMDDVIFEEFKGSGNMEIVLDREMANARIWPAINLPASGTRNEDLLLHPEELRRVNLMRKAMAGQDPQSVMDGLREQMVEYRTNAELLMSIG